MKNISNKLGHQAPRGWRYNSNFNYITIRGDLHYCNSHNFVYNCVEEERKLYNAEPCHYTDVRYGDSRHNYYKDCHLYFSRSKWKGASITLKSCIRRTLQCHNIPLGTIVEFTRDWYYQGKKIDFSYRFKIKKENPLDIKYEINHPNYFKNFATCEFSKNLTDALRANGFIVDVRTNSNFIMGMMVHATQYSGQDASDIDDSEEGEIAIAYGYGKKIGYSSRKNTFMGYVDGCDCILYDYFGEFDKWSRCAGIKKTTPIDEIVKILKEPKDERGIQ